MEDVLIEIAKTPLPTILVLAGILFLFLAIVGKFGASIVVSSQKQSLAGLLGFLLLVGGVVLYLLRPSQEPTPPAPPVIIAPPEQALLPPEAPEIPAPGDVADIAARSRENWFFGNYREAIDGFAVIKDRSDDPAARSLAEARYKWLKPYQDRIIFADDFELDTLKRGIWGIGPGYPQEEGSYFQRVRIDGNYVLEGHGHHHAYAQPVTERFDRSDLPVNFEIHLKFYPVNALRSGAHINTILGPEGRFTVGLYMGEKRAGLFEEIRGRTINKGHRQEFESRWYHIRVSVQGRRVRVFLGDQPMLDYESPSSQPLLGNLNLETLAGTVRFDDLLVIAR